MLGWCLGAVPYVDWTSGGEAHPMSPDPDGTETSADDGWEFVEFRPKPLSTVHLAELVDAAVSDRVMVHGSLPGEGRDIDLLARPLEVAAIHQHLKNEGFTRVGRNLARFRQGSVEFLECIPTGEWDLAEEEIEAIFAIAIPIEGYRHLVRPSALHTLNIMARRIIEGSGQLDEKRRAYIDRALADDPRAWDRAFDNADVWHGEQAVALLYRLYHRGRVTKFEQEKVIESRLLAAGRSSMRARREALRQLASRPSRGAVIAFSGLDGSGKSTQAELLAATLERLGTPSVVEWAKLGEDRWLSHVAASAKRLLRPVHRVTQGRKAPDPMDEEAVSIAGRELRESSRTMTQLWAAMAAASNGLKQRRRALGHLSAGRVMLCDRSVLDSIVHLRWRYGVDERFTAQAWLVNFLSPRPLRAYYLDLPADVAQARKRQDRLEDLQTHARLYEEEMDRAGARRLDATRDPEDLAAEVALDVWLALNDRPPRFRRLRRVVRSLIR